MILCWHARTCIFTLIAFGHCTVSVAWIACTLASSPSNICLAWSQKERLLNSDRIVLVFESSDRCDFLIIFTVFNSPQIWCWLSHISDLDLYWTTDPDLYNLPLPNRTTRTMSIPYVPSVSAPWRMRWKVVACILTLWSRRSNKDVLSLISA